MYNARVHRLRIDELERARAVPNTLRAAQALEMMASGIRLKRVALRNRRPDATEAEIEQMLRSWLMAGD